MIEVRMVQQVSGTRGDGRPWPPVGGTITVSDAEARDLLRSNLGSTPLAIPVVAEERRTETADAPADAKVEVRSEPAAEEPRAEPAAEEPKAAATSAAPVKAKPGPRKTF